MTNRSASLEKVWLTYSHSLSLSHLATDNNCFERTKSSFEVKNHWLTLNDSQQKKEWESRLLKGSIRNFKMVDPVSLGTAT